MYTINIYLHIYIYIYYLRMFTGFCWFIWSCPLDSVWLLLLSYWNLDGFSESFLLMFTGFCWFFRICPLDSAWSSASVWLESRWFFWEFFCWCSLDSAVNLQHSGLDLLAFLCLCLALFLVWSCRCLCLWMSLLRLVLLALSLWIICTICSRRSLATGLERTAEACAALASAHMLFWRAGCSGSLVFCLSLFSFLNVFVVYLFFLFACMFFFLNSWACLGWSSIWPLVDLHASGSGPGCAVPASFCTSPSMLTWAL